MRSLEGADSPMHAPEDITVVGTRLPSLHCRNLALDRLKERETGGLWDGKHLKLLPLGSPALSAYPDDGGVWTCGWGATGEDVHAGVTWTRLECEVRFEADVSTREASLRSLLRSAPTSIKQFEAMLSLMYNIGTKALRESSLMRYHLEGNTEEAALRFAPYNKITVDGHKVVAKGLVLRRAEEANVYCGGEWRLGA